ncbi:MAG: tetratricopeptide repeat protein, partial [Desulfobacterales bacterium]
MKRIVICILILVWPLMAKAHSKDAMAYFNLGLESGRTYKKIEYLTKALELNPGLAAAYENRGMLYYFQEKYDMMIKDFQTYIELVPAKIE